jgi:predicted metalloenzyme YecM
MRLNFRLLNRVQIENWSFQIIPLPFTLLPKNKKIRNYGFQSRRGLVLYDSWYNLL